MSHPAAKVIFGQRLRDGSGQVDSRTWTAGAVVGFDTETTGVDVDSDRIVTAAVVRRGPEGTDVHTWLIDPGVPIPDAAAAVHGITTEFARAQGVPPAGALEQIAGQLATALRRGEPVVAYNACFDLSLLDAELRRHGLATLAERTGGPVLPVIDPLVLDRAMDRYRRGKRRLIDLCRVYGVEGTNGLHTADVDVLATLDVLAALMARFPELAVMDVAALHQLQVRAHREWAESFTAWLLRQGVTRPGPEPYWPIRPVPAGSVATPEQHSARIA